MGRGAHTTDDQKLMILNLNTEGLSIRKIARIMQCSKSKVFNALHLKKTVETRGRKRGTKNRVNVCTCVCIIRYT